MKFQYPIDLMRKRKLSKEFLRYFFVEKLDCQTIWFYELEHLTTLMENNAFSNNVSDELKEVIVAYAKATPGQECLKKYNQVVNLFVR